MSFNAYRCPVSYTHHLNNTEYQVTDEIVSTEVILFISYMMDSIDTQASCKWRQFFLNPDCEDTKHILDSVITDDDLNGIPSYVEAEFSSTLRLRAIASEANKRRSLLSLSLGELIVHVEHQKKEMEDGAQAWQKERSRGWRRAGTGLQQFVVDFDSFLSGFSGVVEVVKAADNAYGGAATLALSVFFSVSILRPFESDSQK